MLDPWIIEEIRRRENERRQAESRPVIELPIAPPAREMEVEEDLEDVERGVVIIDYSVC